MKAVFPAAALALATLVAAPAPASAQKVIPEAVRMFEPHLLRIGDYVRAWPRPEGPPLQGTIVGFSTDTLTVTGHDDAQLVTLAALSRLEVRRRSTHTARGALIGAGIGLVGSAFVITRELLGHEVRTGERIGWTAAFTAVGAGAGALTGHLVRTDRWQPVDLVTLKPQPPRRHGDLSPPGLRLAWTVRF